MVPHGCTIRTRFDRDTESFLRQLSMQIQTNVSQFVAQENGDVSLGERKPFHITILEISPMLNVPYVLSTVNSIASRTARITGSVLPFCQVCDNGEVRIKVSCNDIVMLGHEFSSSLPGSNNWYSQTNESLFITIGVFHGIHRFDFETWLNKELSTNNELFPHFYSDYICFSDEWLYVAHAHEQTIALGGSAVTTALGDVNGLQGMDAAMDGNDIEGLLDSFTLSAEEAAMAAVADDDEEHKNKAHKGGKKQRDYADGDKGHHKREAENKKQAAQAAQAAAAAAAAEEEVPEPLPTPPADAPYQPTAPPAGGSVWGSASNGKIAPPSAILAMRESGRTVATPKAVMAAPVKKAVAAPTAAAMAAKSAGAATKAGDKKEDTKPGVEEHGAPSGGSSGPNWVCPHCKVVVYGRRAACFKCKTAKPANAQPSSSAPAAGGGGAARAATGGAGGAGAHLYPRKPKDGDVRDGDWICSGCKGHNFASKIACFTCRSPRPPGYVIDTPDATTSETKADRKPGDWTCPKCNENVFAKRNRCYKCSTSKPKAMSDA